MYYIPNEVRQAMLLDFHMIGLLQLLPQYNGIGIWGTYQGELFVCEASDDPAEEANDGNTDFCGCRC